MVAIARPAARARLHETVPDWRLGGGQHDRLARADAARTQMIEAYGYKVIRYWNSEVMENLDGVLEDILRHLNIALD
jgi:very-short-patch-repair endonuclease